MYKSDQSYTPHHGAFRRQIYHISLIKHYMYQNCINNYVQESIQYPKKKISYQTCVIVKDPLILMIKAFNIKGFNKKKTSEQLYVLFCLRTNIKKNQMACSMVYAHGIVTLSLVSSRTVFISQTSVHDIFYGIEVRQAVLYLIKGKMF